MDSNLDKDNKIKQLQNKITFYQEEEKRRQKQKKTWRNWLLKVISGSLLGKDLKEGLQKLFHQLPNNITKDTLAHVIAGIFFRLTRISVFAALAVFIPILLLWQQNNLINDQTLLLQKQNEKLDYQINLEESTRRSSLISMMSNIMDKVDEELKNDYNNDSLRNLSPQLISRIVALSKSFKPYKYLENDTLISTSLSPERGQMLLSLIEIGLDKKTQKKINDKVIFKQADLKNVYLSKIKIEKINLEQADLSHINLSGATLNGVNLMYANLRGADLSGVIMNRITDTLELYPFTFKSRSTVLAKANLKDANLRGADLEGVMLLGADLTNAELRNTNFKNADLREVNFKGVKNLNYKQLMSAATLHNCINLPKDIRKKLEQESPELLKIDAFLINN